MERVLAVDLLRAAPARVAREVGVRRAHDEARPGVARALEEVAGFLRLLRGDAADEVRVPGRAEPVRLGELRGRGRVAASPVRRAALGDAVVALDVRRALDAEARHRRPPGHAGDLLLERQAPDEVGDALLGRPVRILEGEERGRDQESQSRHDTPPGAARLTVRTAAILASLMDSGGNGFLHSVLTSRVYDVARETPLDPAPRLSRRLGHQVLLKREDLQPVFSFKLRGAYNKIAHLAAAERARGVITASAGNHAQGVALSARAARHPRGDRDAADDARDQGRGRARDGGGGRARGRLLLGRAGARRRARRARPGSSSSTRSTTRW